MPSNKANALKVKRQFQEGAQEQMFREASFKRGRLYWIVNNTSNRRSDRPVTLEEANDYIRGVERHYTLHPVN